LFEKEQTMKLFRALTVIFSLGFALSAGGATLTTDPLTGLPLDPATDFHHLGNEPMKMRDSQICKSTMQGDFYSSVDAKVDATVAWYAAHLAGFHKSHAYAAGRSQDAFYNDAGTMLVYVTGSPGKEGDNTDTYAVTYYLFKPGLLAKTILSFTQQKIVCQ
jgi:hypothetical protein